MSQSFAEALSWVPVSATFSGTLGRAHEYARAQGHRTVTLEHLLLALAEDPDAATVLQASNIDIARLMGDASGHLGHHEDRFAPGQPVDPGADEALIRILDYAAAAARQSRRREINGAIVLAAIVGEARSVAAHMLQAQGLTFEGAIRALQRAPSQPAAPSPAVLPQAVPVPAAPPVDHPSAINGVATQTNEQILASVRRRIDANRNAPKPAPAGPSRDPYPTPSISAPSKPAWDESKPAPVARPVEAAQPLPAPEPIRQPETHMPTGQGLPSAPATPSITTPRLNVEVSAASNAEPPRAGAASSPRTSSESDGLQREAFNGDEAPQAGLRNAIEEALPPRRPPPLPPTISNPVSGRAAESSPGPARPRQLGAPVVPASSIAWPEPVRPQPTALPPSLATPPRLQPASPPKAGEVNPFDGGIAGAPYPEPDSVPPRPPTNLPVAVPRSKSAKAPSALPIEPGQLAENIPRNMRVGRTELVEVRVGRAAIRGMADGLPGSAPSHLHELIVTKAMSVRLRAADGGFQIEGSSPETQWIEHQIGTKADDFASWRWNVTPTKRGSRQLQLVVSARTIAPDGLSADTALPEQVFDISVQADYGRMFRRAAGWAGLMLVGGALSRLGQGSFETVAAIWRGFQ